MVYGLHIGSMGITTIAMRDMDYLLGRIKQGLAANSYVNESAVSASIVVPILRALGWDDTDPNELRPQYRNARGLVDFALFGGPLRRATVFLEVKAVGNAKGADQQLFEYAFHDGVPFGVLTDGRFWHIYLPMQAGAYSERRVSLIDLVSDDFGEVAVKLNRYLARERIENGTAVADAEHDYRALASGRIAEAALPSAWADLLNAPDSPVAGWLTDRAAALCGHRPDTALVASFLARKSGPDVASGLIPTFGTLGFEPR
jgi:predicted type IV restriction endonuclease